MQRLLHYKSDVTIKNSPVFNFLISGTLLGSNLHELLTYFDNFYQNFLSFSGNSEIDTKFSPFIL